MHAWMPGKLTGAFLDRAETRPGQNGNQDPPPAKDMRIRCVAEVSGRSFFAFVSGKVWHEISEQS